MKEDIERTIRAANVLFEEGDKEPARRAFIEVEGMVKMLSIVTGKKYSVSLAGLSEV